MKPTLLAAGLVACVAIATSAAIAQPIAVLDVAKGSKSTLSQHERIEQKLDRILELLKAPTTPVIPPVVTKPPEPPPPDVPAAANPFTDWCAQGLSLVDIAVWKLQRALTPQEVKQALAAGCGGPGNAASNGGPSAPAGNPDPSGFDLGTGGGTVLVHQVAAGQPVTFTFTIPDPGRVPELFVFGVSGSRFESFTDSGPGFSGRVTRPNDGRHAPLEGRWLAAGTYSYTVAAEPAGSLGIQLNR